MVCLVHGCNGGLVWVRVYWLKRICVVDGCKGIHRVFWRAVCGRHGADGSGKCYTRDWEMYRGETIGHAVDTCVECGLSDSCIRRKDASTRLTQKAHEVNG